LTQIYTIGASLKKLYSIYVILRLVEYDGNSVSVLYYVQYYDKKIMVYHIITKQYSCLLNECTNWLIKINIILKNTMDEHEIYCTNTVWLVWKTISNTLQANASSVTNSGADETIALYTICSEYKIITLYWQSIFYN
jgi:hypothetical protein